MLNKVLANQAEQIAVTPDQAAFVLKNKSDFKNQLDVDVSMYNTNIANSFINNKLQNNPDWNKYLQDPFRRNNPDYKRWKSVEDLMSEQEYTSIADKYGDNLAKQADIVLDFVKPQSTWDRVAMGYNAARYGLRYAAARKDLSDALEDGDETRITEARNKLQEELFSLQYNSYEFESDTLNTGASIAASIARNLPAMIGSDLAITAASGLVSGGIGAVVGGARAAKRVAEIGKAAKLTAEGIRAARIAKKAAKIAKTGVEASKTAARGGIVFGDTYKIESGSILQELDRSHPELSEDQKRDLAHAGGIINAAIETIPMVMGVGFQAGMSKVLSKATTNAMLKSGVGSKVVSNPTFLREFKKQVEKNVFNFKKFTGDVAIDMASNGIQEVLQDCIQKATEYVIDNPDTSVLEAGWDLFTDFVENPLADRNAEMLKTLMNVMIVSPVFSAAPTIVDTTIKQIGSGSMYKKAAGAQKNRKLADDLNKWAKDNEVNSVAPSVVNNNLANMVKNGDAPATVYFDVKSVQEALQSSEAEVQEAMQKLNMATRYEESKTNGGTIEMTLPEYNELVNQEKSGKLFQIVRSMVSFDPNSLSSAEFLRYMTTDGSALSVLEGAMEDSESAYNKAYNKFIESGWDEKQARFDATMAQLVSNRLASVTGGGMTGSEYFAKNIDIRTGQDSTVAPAGALQQFVGSRKEETVNDIADKLGKRAELDQARAMEKESVDKGEMPDYEAIWAQTGWYKNEDTSWSYEISDAEAALDMSKFLTKSGKVYTGVHTTLGEVWDNDALFNVIPWAKDVYLHVGKSNITRKMNSGDTIAKMVPFSRRGSNKQEYELIVNATKLAEAVRSGEDAELALKSEIVHELQHAIQWEFDMMRATSSGSQIQQPVGLDGLTEEQLANWQKLKALEAAVNDLVSKYNIHLERKNFGKNALFGNRNKILSAVQTEEEKQTVKDFVDKFIETKDYNYFSSEDYYRRSHEVQARNSQYRMQLTESQRKSVSPSATKDIAGKTRVGYAPRPMDVPMQTREIRTIKFAGAPIEPIQQETGEGVTTTPAQEAPQSKAVAGWFEREGDKLIVNLTKAVNPTTFSHEMFHAFSNVLMEQYNNGQLSKYWKRQAENLFESVGAKPNADGKVVLTNTQEEHLADQFTTYILEGKVPSAEVSSIFALIKDWFKKAYLDFGIRHLGLNKKVIEVFDSIFMAQEEVEQRQRALAMIEFPMPEGADQGLYDKYVSHLLNSRAKASAKLVRAWYGLQKYKTSKEYTKRRGDIYNAVRSELEQSIAYQYQAILDKNNGDHVAAYNEYIGKHPEALESETPITPEVLQEMVDNLPTIDQEANRLTQQQIDEEMAVKFKIDKEPAANKALRNTEKVKALLAEALLHEGKKLSDFETEYSAFLDNAERIIAKLSISAKKNTKGIRNFTYWVNQEGMAVERYAYAYAQQDKAEMAQQRRNQALFTMIRIRGEEIDNRAMRFKTQFQEKLRGNQKKEIVNKDTGERADLYTADAWDLMQSIIEKFGFKIVSKARTNKTVAEKMEDWIKDQENKSMTTIGFLRNFIPFIGKGYEGEFSQMSVNMFEQLENIMTAVNATARTEQFVIREGEKLHMNELKRDVVQTLEQKGIKPTTKAQGWLGKTFGGLGKWTNPEPVLQAFFSEKVLNAVFRPFFSAAATADSKGNSWIAQYRKARDKIKLTGEYTTYSNGVRLTDAQVVDLFLSMGTQHAYENFIKAFRINEEQAEQVVSEALTTNPELANFVTEYWNLMSEAADAMNESHKKRMNRVLVRKEPRAFTINGIQFTGGYVPENKGLLREISEGDYNSLQMGLLSNEKEITKEADGTVKSIIDNTESRLGLFAKWAYAAPEYNNICKFMSDPEVKATVGEGLTEFIFNWLWAFQTPSVDTSGVVRPLTSLVSVAALGFRSMQGLIQLSGLVPAVATIGAKNVVFGLRKTIMTGDIFNPIKNARGKSAYMANRYDNPMGSILGFDKKDIKRTKLGDVYQRAGMSIIALFDAVVASAVWEGAHADGISQGLSEQEAILKADAAVRVSQTDSMAASRSQALQSPWARAITSFATYIMGMQSVVRANLAAGERFKAALFAVNYMVFATFFESMYREAVSADDEDDDKKYIERVRTRWYNDMVKTLGSSAIPAFGFGGSVSAALASGIEKAFDVEDEIFESYAPSSALHTYLSQMYYLAQNIPAALVGDEEAQAKAIVNSIGLVSSEGKKIAKEWLNQ